MHEPYQITSSRKELEDDDDVQFHQTLRVPSIMLRDYEAFEALNDLTQVDRASYNIAALLIGWNYDECLLSG